MNGNFIRARDLAERWGVTPRRINQFCADGSLPGAYKDGKFWMIPEDCARPAVLRRKKAILPLPVSASELPSVSVENDSRLTDASLLRESASGHIGFMNSIPTIHTSSRRLPCPVGITSYKEVSRECYYVDKTRMIRDLIDDHSKVYLFTRPRRFGKSLTMDMIRTYFEKTPEDTSVYFRDRQIWTCGPAYQRLQGSSPVIFLSFKDAHQTTWPDMYKSLCFTIREEFARHQGLLDNPSLTDYDRRYYERILANEADPTDYQFSIGKLSALLSVHYGRKAVILIDEYDTPIQQGHLHNYYDEVIGFMRNLLSSALKDNDHLAFGVLTGILRIAKESLFSGLNNLMVNTILDEKYSEYFGFTEQEVSDMASYYGRETHLQEIREWYDGYLFGSTQIYNPWSVISYFNNQGQPKAFWSRTSGNEIIHQLLTSAGTELRDALTCLLQGREVQALIDTDIIYPEVTEDPDTVLSFLLVAGYLRIVKTISTWDDNPICSLAIANREIHSVFRREILDYYPTLFTGALLRNFEFSMRTGNAALLTSSLRSYLTQSASCFDTAGESFYHGTVFGMLAIMEDQYYITSNREAGSGRFDIQLEPRDKSRMGYIIEFKAGKGLNDTELQTLADSALNQIHEKDYISDLKYRGIRKIGLFGIAFSGKQAECSYEER